MALQAVPYFLRGDGFAIMRDGPRLHLLTGNQRRWTIDPAVFGTQASVRAVRTEEAISISLKNAVFPGTHLPADFVCRLKKQTGVWMFRLAMDSGVDVSAALLDWLDSTAVASGRWRTQRFSPFDGLSIAFARTPSVTFAPDWTLSVNAPVSASVQGLKQTLPASGFEIVLNSSQTITGVAAERSTSVIIPRGAAKWDIDLAREGTTGWLLDHEKDGTLFDELRIEAAHTGDGIQRSALLTQLADNSTALQFQPGGALCTDCGEPFALPLRNPRLAFSLESDPQSSLVADLSEEKVWAHDKDVSYLFGASKDAPHFELHEGETGQAAPQISPGICEVCFPNDNVCMNLKLDVPRAVPFTWATVLAPFERFLGWMHLVPTHEGKKLILDLQAGDLLCVDRPKDFLSLKFGFENMRLITGACPRIVHVHHAGEPIVKVIFPPQHVAEEAFFHTDDPGIKTLDVPIGPVELQDYSPDPAHPTLLDLKKKYELDYIPPPTVPPPPVPPAPPKPDRAPRTELSGETRLIFTLPKGCDIRCETEALLDWKKWAPKVAPVAMSSASQEDLNNLPKIVDPNLPVAYTSIEMPWHLDLSPSDLGRWAHSVKPVESPKKIVELWHTRLGVQPKPANEDDKKYWVDELDTKNRIARAIWSPDYKPVDDPTCNLNPTPPNPFPNHYKAGDPPFRMSLDGRDRCELVHLTSNYAITQQAEFCKTPLPAKPLLPPAPVQINQMILTAMGGYLNAFGQWNPCKVDMNHQLTVQMWEHIATLGRDHYVKVVYKGYLAPFGLRASLVKVTQRYFALNADKNWVAVLHQHMYIVVKNEKKQCPVLGQPYGGRGFPFSYVQPVTLRTPFLNDPSQQSWPTDCANPNKQTQSLFWPMVPPTIATPPKCGGDPAGVIFDFRLRFTDVTGVHSGEASMPLLFVASDVAQRPGYGTGTDYYSQDAVNFYNLGYGDKGDDRYLTADFNGQKFSFARSAKPGDTDFETGVIGWRAVPLTNINITVAGAAAVAGANSPYVTFTENTSKVSVNQTLDPSGVFSISLGQGSYFVAVTTPQVPPNPAVTVSSAPATITVVNDNTPYTLTISLIDPAHFSSVPALTARNGKIPSPLDLYRNDLPFFYPAVDYAKITSTSIKRVTGQGDPRKFTFFPTYLSDGFNAKTNTGEAFLQKHPDDELSLQFGGMSKNVDKAGGLASPDTLVAGFSRKSGAIGGKKDSTQPAGAANGVVVTSVSTFSSGKFDAADFFGGLISAKLLGAVKLSDIIAPLAHDLVSNLEKAPQMLEQASYALQEAVTYTKKAADGVDAFQKLQVQGIPNPLASRLSSQGQQVAAASAALTAAPQDLISQGVAEAQLVARIVDYATALQGALQNPLSLIEDTILQALIEVVGDILGSNQVAITAAMQQLIDKFTAAVDDAIQKVGSALDDLIARLNKEENKVVDLMTLGQQVAGKDQEAAKKLISSLAPELNNLKDLKKLIDDLAGTNNQQGKIAALGTSIKAFAGNPLDLQQIPQVMGDLSGVLVDVQQIYQKAGFLGVVIKPPVLTGNDFPTVITKIRGSLLKLWTQADYGSDLVKAVLAQLENDCVQLASVYDQTTAQQILQNLRLLQNAVAKAATYQSPDPKKVPTLGNVELYRQLQLLQKMQGHILAALSALQVLATQPVPGGLSAAVQASAQAAADDIKITTAPALAKALTVSAQLGNVSGNTSIEVLLTTLTSIAQAAGPIAASSTDTLQKMQALRGRIQNDPANLALQLLHYNLSIDYQRPLAMALSYMAYLQSAATDAALTAFHDVIDPIEKLATALQSGLCDLKNIWDSFVAAISTKRGANSGVLGITTLFAADFDNIEAAFSDVCTGSLTPSQFIHNGQALIAAFVGLEKDVRNKIQNLPATVMALLQDEIKQAAEELLAQLLTDIPIPTSVNLSYTWNPDIQSCEPVFVLNDDASFSITARAQASLSLTTSPSIDASFDIQAKLTNFSINLISEDPFITLNIDSLSFTSHNGSKPDCRMHLKNVAFGSMMKFVQDLADALDPSDGPFVELAADSIRAGFRFAIESMTLGAFNLMQLAIEVAVSLPFDGTPVRCEFGLSDQQQPFLLSCGIYGGGGFLQLQLGLDGVQLLQGAFEFGVCADISIGPLKGSGFVVAGIYFRIAKNDSEVCGFVHAHGHMDIFGIISMDVDLYVAVCYLNGSVQGIATFSVSISIAFFSETFTMQAHYGFQGSDSQSASNRLDDGSTLEAMMLFPEFRGETDSLANDASPARAAQAQPKAKSYCPEKWQQNDIFIDEHLWAKYYNSFV